MKYMSESNNDSDIWKWWFSSFSNISNGHYETIVQGVTIVIEYTANRICSLLTVDASLIAVFTAPASFQSVRRFGTLFADLFLVVQKNKLKIPHGDNVQECTIEFKEVSSAMTALHLTGMELAPHRPILQTKPSITIPPKPMLPTTLTFPTFTTQSLTTIRSANPSISPTVAQFDPAKAEEISRTVYIGNINSSISDPELIQFFSACGPVAYVKMAGDPAQPTRFAFLEFATFEGAQAAMLMNGVMLGDRPLKVNHSKNAINKTPKKTDAPDVQATMRRVREAQLRIANRLNTDKLLATANASLDVVASTNVPRSRSRSNSILGKVKSLRIKKNDKNSDNGSNDSNNAAVSKRPSSILNNGSENKEKRRSIFGGGGGKSNGGIVVEKVEKKEVTVIPPKNETNVENYEKTLKDDLSKTNESLQKDLAKNNAEIEALKHAIEEEKSRGANEIEDLKQKLSSKIDELSNLNNIIQNSNQEINELKAKLTQEESLKEKLKAEIDESKKQIEKINKDAIEQKTSSSEAKVALEVSKHEINQLKSELSQRNSTMQSLNQELISSRKEVDKLKKESEQRNKSASSLHSDLENTKLALQSSKDEINKLKGELDNSRKQTKNFEFELSNNKKELENVKRNSINEINEKFVDRSEYENILSDLNKYIEINQNLNQEIEKLKFNQPISEKRDEAIRQARNSKSEYDTLQNFFNNIQSDSEEKIKSLQELRSQLDAKEQTILHQTNVIHSMVPKITYDSLNQSLLNKQSELEYVKAELQTTKSDLESIKTELHQVKSDFDSRLGGDSSSIDEIKTQLSSARAQLQANIWEKNRSDIIISELKSKLDGLSANQSNLLESLNQKLRLELEQTRIQVKNVEKLMSDNEKLRAENQKLQSEIGQSRAQVLPDNEKLRAENAEAVKNDKTSSSSHKYNGISINRSNSNISSSDDSETSPTSPQSSNKNNPNIIKNNTNGNVNGNVNGSKVKKNK
ncbi:10848_t:CDS:10, partial [Entrophospora sp. SA101]